MHEHAKVNRNIATLEYAIWNPASNIGTLYSHGEYMITSAPGIPCAYDINILNWLLYKAQSKKSPLIKYHSFRTLIMDLGYVPSKKSYRLVEESLRRWSCVVLNYPQDKYFRSPLKTLVFRRINIGSPTSGKSLAVEIEFTKEFFKLNNSKYSAKLPVKATASLKPYTRRLYEILVKSFYNREDWSCGIDKLKSKMMCDYTDYEFVRRVKSGVKEMKHLIDVKVETNGKVLEFKKFVP